MNHANLFNDQVLYPDAFKQFHCNDNWQLGRRLRNDMPPGHDIMVLN